MSVLPPNSTLEDARSSATTYEASLEPTRRKRLGQFFSGLPLGRLLASIALDREALTVIDPMAGHGDLLDAALECSSRHGASLVRVDGVEIDRPTADMCMRRLEGWRRELGTEAIVIRARDAFDGEASAEYADNGYGLVITNPPYVRYQTQATVDASESQRSPDDIRRDLRSLVGARTNRAEWPIWQAIVDGYSGLADLSVPAWILAASLVRPGGVLALVAPATWRSRDYGDIIQYLLARCFRLRYLIEDTQPGWFSDALVRTQLVVARRRSANEARVSLAQRGTEHQPIVSVRVSPPAGDSRSLVGSAFPGEDPEGQFTGWLGRLSGGGEDPERGLAWSTSSLNEFADDIVTTSRRRSWFSSLEPQVSGPLFGNGNRLSRNIIPAPLRPLLEGIATVDVVLPEDTQLFISQGLRTGCNGFFYVDVIESVTDESVRIRLSSLFNDEEIVLPANCLVPVIRRQAEIESPVKREALTGRVLDLSRWILPEDAEAVQGARRGYERDGSDIPSVMPHPLADFVRRAAETVYGAGTEGVRISELSAVKTNARGTATGRTPRFWYMLPPFARRHFPAAFVARINQGIPWVEVNDDPPALVDANFSTIWSDELKWSRFAMCAVLNSSWCRVCMEALGTPLGGGALKLEATQLRRLPLPQVTDADQPFLDAEGRRVALDRGASLGAIDRFVIERVTGMSLGPADSDELTKRLRSTADTMCRDRQKQRV
jgi:hypothetical protein